MAIFALMFAAQGMYRAFNPKNVKSKPIYHKTWPDEIVPASKFVKSL